MSFVRPYRTLLRLYPNDYRTQFATEMETAFEQAIRERQRQPVWVFVGFLLGEFTDLLIGAGTECIAKLTTDSSVKGNCLPDLRMMRPPGVPRELWFAGTCLEVSRPSLPPEVMEAQERMAMLVNRMVDAIAKHDFPGARRYSFEERQVCNELRRLREKYNIEDSATNQCW